MSDRDEIVEVVAKGLHTGEQARVDDAVAALSSARSSQEAYALLRDASLLNEERAFANVAHAAFKKDGDIVFSNPFTNYCVQIDMPTPPAASHSISDVRSDDRYRGDQSSYETNAGNRMRETYYSDTREHGDRPDRRARYEGRPYGRQQADYETYRPAGKGSSRKYED